METPASRATSEMVILPDPTSPSLRAAGCGKPFAPARS
jgi:hypothetical protein